MIAFDLPTPELRGKAHETGCSANGLLLLDLRVAVDPVPPAAQPDRGRGGRRHWRSCARA